MFAQVGCQYGTRVTPICNRNGAVLLFRTIDAIHEYCRAHDIEFATCTGAMTLDDSIEYRATRKYPASTVNTAL